MGGAIHAMGFLKFSDSSAYARTVDSGFRNNWRFEGAARKVWSREERDLGRV